jgi:hypothetical protein
MVEQSTAASHALSQEAEALNMLTGQFKLDTVQAPRASVTKLGKGPAGAAPRLALVKAERPRRVTQAAATNTAEAWEEL